MSYNRQSPDGGRPYYGGQSRESYDQYPSPGYNQRNESFDQNKHYEQGPQYSDRSSHYSEHGPYYDQNYSNEPLSVGAPLPHGSEKIEVSNADPSDHMYVPYDKPSSPYYSDRANPHPPYNEYQYADHERAAPDDNRYIDSKNNAPFHARTGVYPGSPTQSEAKLLVGPDSLKKPRKRTCLDYTLCRCWPVWARWICCSCLLILVGLIIAAAVIFFTFKMPSISMNGVTSQPNVPEYVQNGSSFSFNFALKIGVVNPNIIGATFEKIKAVAYYPIDQTNMGGGDLTNVNFRARGVTNLTFPFNITYDPVLDKDQAILSDIASRCGLLGDTKRPIAISYTVTLYIRFLFVTITPPSIKQNTSLDCPIQDGQIPPFVQNLVPAGVPGFNPSAPAAT